jgi:hypothetical protein
MEVGRLHEALNQTLTPIKARRQDAGMAQGVPPDETAFGLGFHQDTLWTTYLQFKGTPVNESELKRRKAQCHRIVTGQKKRGYP